MNFLSNHLPKQENNGIFKILPYKAIGRVVGGGRSERLPLIRAGSITDQRVGCCCF